MSSEFTINEVAFNDPAGMGAYEVGHYRQHLDYQAVLAARSPPIILPTFPIFHSTCGWTITRRSTCCSTPHLDCNDDQSCAVRTRHRHHLPA